MIGKKKEKKNVLQRATNQHNDCMPSLRETPWATTHTHRQTDIPLNHTVRFRLFLIKIRHRIKMSSLMEYAGGFKDFPWDSTN